MRIDSLSAQEAYRGSQIGPRSAMESARVAAKISAAYSSVEKYVGRDVVVTFQNRQSGTASRKTGLEGSGDYSNLSKNIASQRVSSPPASLVMDQALSTQASAQSLRTDQTGKVKMVEREYGLTSHSKSGISGNFSATSSPSSKSTFRITA